MNSMNDSIAVLVLQGIIVAGEIARLIRTLGVHTLIGNGSKLAKRSSQRD